MRRIIPWLIVLAASGSTTAFAQTSGSIELTMTRAGAGWKAGAKIALTGQQLLSDVRDLKISNNEIQFNISVLEAELRFTGTIAAERLGGASRRSRKA
jgi:hypothetical protein